MLYLIVGNTGAGKTTYALQLQAEKGGIHFSIDQWNKLLYLQDKKEDDGLDWFLERIEREESLMMELIIQLEKQGLNSILDLGFSKFEHRQKFRDFAEKHGFQSIIHYLDVSKEIRWERVRKRNREKGESFEFEVRQQELEFMENWFEVPTEDELKHEVNS